MNFERRWNERFFLSTNYCLHNNENIKWIDCYICLSCSFDFNHNKSIQYQIDENYYHLEYYIIWLFYDFCNIFGIFQSICVEIALSEPTIKVLISFSIATWFDCLTSFVLL
jgi:hypothetical protein